MEILAAVIGALIATAAASIITLLAGRRALRNDLAIRMGNAAYGVYRRSVQYRRWIQHNEVTDERRQAMLETLEDRHSDGRIEMDALLKSIDLYFGARSRPSIAWHEVIDRLTVLHMHHSGADRAAAEAVPRLRGAQHSGLDTDALLDAEQLASGIGYAIAFAMWQVRRAPMRLRAEEPKRPDAEASAH